LVGQFPSESPLDRRPELEIKLLHPALGMVLPVHFSSVNGKKETAPSMVFAIAALMFQFTPAIQAIPDVDVRSTAPVVKSASAPAGDLPDRPQPSSTSSVKSESAGATSGTLTMVSLETSEKNSQALSAIRLPDSTPAKPVRVISAETYPKRDWILLSIAQHSAATFDAYSTRQAVATGATEADPFMRPFANSPGIYAAIQVGPAILDFAARRMQRSENNFIRRSWWIPQTASTGLYVISGVHNMSVANRH